MKQFFLILIGLVFIQNAYALNCLKTRAALDIGSGSTRLKVAQVNTCLQKIVKVLYEAESKVDYKEDLEKSKNQKFSKKILKDSLTSISNLKLQADKHSPSEYIAVATAAFRDAINSNQFVKIIKENTGIEIKVIDQATEAKIGFVAASTIADKDAKNIVVWDIGGGSQQIITKDKDFTIFEGNLASVGFKNHIIEKLQSNELKKTDSPNPMGKKIAAAATLFAKKSASNVDATIKEKIKAGAQVLGIGGVHYYSIKGQTGAKNNMYSQQMVKAALDKQALKSDKDIGGDYAATDVSNLALVLGYMQSLDIKKIKVGKINLTDGALLYY